MTRGNQREHDRARAQAKQTQKAQIVERMCHKFLFLCSGSVFTWLVGLTFWQEGRPEDRNLNDAEKLAAKVAAKQAQKEKEQREQECAI
jgi:hypothetical protein